MKKMRRKVKVGITMGDPSGIGPSIIKGALKKLGPIAEFIVIGDEWVFEKVQSSKLKAQSSKLSSTGYKEACGISPAIKYNGRKNYTFIDLDNIAHKNFKFGQIKAEYGKASIEYLDKALGLIEKKEIDCLVTSPISKEAINLAGFSYSGHTEYFSERCLAKDTVMMLLNRHLKFSLATRHIPLIDVPAAINEERLYKTISVTHRALKNLFSIEEPRIVVCGVNPHASDNGIIGKEENRIIKPLLESLKKTIPSLDGPLSADVAIAKAKLKRYDCVIAMYHDQALIALKLLGNDTGVNLTLGLPFIRTSPLHGTAFDIAGTNLANPNSLIAAVRLAIRCTLNQKRD